MKTPSATIATGTPPGYRSVRESHLEYPRGRDDTHEPLAAHHRNQRRATARHDRGHLDYGVFRFHRRHVRRRLVQHFSDRLAAELVRDAIGHRLAQHSCERRILLDVWRYEQADDLR